MLCGEADMSDKNRVTAYLLHQLQLCAAVLLARVRRGVRCGCRGIGILSRIVPIHP